MAWEPRIHAKDCINKPLIGLLEHRDSDLENLHFVLDPEAPTKHLLDHRHVPFPTVTKHSIFENDKGNSCNQNPKPIMIVNKLHIHKGHQQLIKVDYQRVPKKKEHVYTLIVRIILASP